MATPKVTMPEARAARGWAEQSATEAKSRQVVAPCQVGVVPATAQAKTQETGFYPIRRGTSPRTPFLLLILLLQASLVEGCRFPPAILRKGGPHVSPYRASWEQLADLARDVAAHVDERSS